MLHLRRRRRLLGAVALVAAAGALEGARRAARSARSVDVGYQTEAPRGRPAGESVPAPPVRAPTADDASLAHAAPSRKGGRRRILANGLAVTAVLLAVLGVGQLRGGASGAPSVVAEQPRWALPRAHAPAEVSSAGPVEHPTVAIPAEIRIAAIGVASAVVPVGLASDGTLGLPPPGAAGWYSLGVRPGERGYTVVAAHVDNHRGPDVFHQLRTLKPGDRVVIVSVDGTSRTFEVQRVEQQRKELLPSSAIWQPVDHSMLALITCGGDFDRRTRSYLDNVVVHAALLQ